MWWPESYEDAAFVKHAFSTDVNSDIFHVGYRQSSELFGLLHADYSFGLGLFGYSHDLAGAQKFSDSNVLMTSSGCKSMAANSEEISDSCPPAAIGVCKYKLGNNAREKFSR